MKSNENARVTMRVAASLTMAAAMAVPASMALASDVPASTNSATDTPAVAQETHQHAISQVVKARAIGEFAYDQTTVSSRAELAKFQGATKVLCGSKIAASADDHLGWGVMVSGDVENAYVATLDSLQDEKSESRLMTCSCGGNPAGGRAIVTAEATGVPVSTLIARAGVAEGANTVTFVSADGTRVAMPLSYVIGRHGMLCTQLNGEDLAGTVGGSNQLWLAKTPANYFVRDVAEIIVTAEDEADIPSNPGEGVEHPNSPNAAILAGAQA